MLYNTFFSFNSIPLCFILIKGAGIVKIPTLTVADKKFHYVLIFVMQDSISRRGRNDLTGPAVGVHILYLFF